MRVRRLLSEEHSERLKQVNCPKCKNHPLVEASRDEKMPKLKYDPGEKFWACSSAEGSSCYLLSSVEVDTIFETAEGNKPVSFEEEAPPIPVIPVAKIVRRRRGEIFDITHIAQANV